MPEIEDSNIIDAAIGVYQRNPLLRMIVAAHPLVSVVEAGVLGGYEWYRNRRMHVFGKEVVALNIDPPEERIRQRDFLDAYSACARRVLETTSDEKIKDFAALFASYYEGGVFSSVDHFEEYLAVLHDLSLREIQILIVLHRLETENPLRQGENVLQRANRIWGDFAAEVESRIGAPRAHLPAIMTRLERTGLYTTIVGGYWDYVGERGHVTPFFEALVEALKISTPGSPARERGSE
jgi:hypothetical protein